MTSRRQPVISMACISSLVMAILLDDSYFCQLYRTRVCGCSLALQQGKRPFPSGAHSRRRSPRRMPLWAEGWYSSPSLSLEGIPTSLNQPGEGLASPFIFMPSPSAKARLSLNFLLSCPQNCSLPGPCAIVSSKKEKTLTVLWVSISLLAPPSGASGSLFIPGMFPCSVQNSGKSSACSVRQCPFYCGHKSIALCQREDSIKNCGA